MTALTQSELDALRREAEQAIRTRYLWSLSAETLLALLDRIAQLAADLDWAKKEFAAAQGQADSNYKRWCEAQTRIAELESALEPFADAAADDDSGARDASDIWESPVAVNITFGDLRGAVRALADRSFDEKETVKTDQKGQTAAIEGSDIVIRVPIDALSTAPNTAWDMHFGAAAEKWRVVDARLFAEEFVRELNRESGTGETLVTAMLDRAAIEVAEQGGDGVDYSTVE